jgi:Fic family protein
MKIPPTYIENSKIVRLLIQIEELVQTYKDQKYNPITLKYHRRKSILKSSLYSARIEGNNLDDRILTNFHSVPQSNAKIELSNLVGAIESVQKRDWSKNLELSDLKDLHHLAMRGLLGGAGELRQEPSAIYNMAGIAVYLCPAPSDLSKLLSDLLSFINKEQTYSPLVQVAISHYVFEKIHPFQDGNGRVGRVLIHLLIKKYGYDLLGLLSFEEYIDKNRQDYYDLLGQEKNNIVDFVEFVLESFVYGLRQGLVDLSVPRDTSPRTLLMPRRQELLALITDHPFASFNFIHRRFMAVPGRTIRYDLKYLSDHEYIIKLGSTKGVLYSPK